MESPFDGCISTSSWSADEGNSFVNDTGCFVTTEVTGKAVGRLADVVVAVELGGTIGFGDPVDVTLADVVEPDVEDN